MTVIRYILVVIMIGIAIFLSGCTGTKDIAEKSYQNLNVGETAILSYDNTKLAVTLKSVKKIENPSDPDYNSMDGKIWEGENLIAVKLEIKNIGSSGSKQPSNFKWYAKGVDYAGFSYDAPYGGLVPWGMYPEDNIEGTIKIYRVPDKGLKGLKFLYACGEEASWIIFP
ncbi:MAG: hypothetical protein KKI06_12025 [Euryarchaeota archaeon]|nr:hypothetical protein [Euryarchaeota archaeon]